MIDTHGMSRIYKETKLDNKINGRNTATRNVLFETIIQIKTGRGHPTQSALPEQHFPKVSRTSGQHTKTSSRTPTDRKSMHKPPPNSQYNPDNNTNTELRRTLSIFKHNSQPATHYVPPSTAVQYQHLPTTEHHQASSYVTQHQNSRTNKTTTNSSMYS